MTARRLDPRLIAALLLLARRLSFNFGHGSLPKQAEVVSKYVKKGNPLFVEGRLQPDTWAIKHQSSEPGRGDYFIPM